MGQQNGNISTEYYGFKNSGDSPDFVKNNNGDITHKFISLPGGVRVVIKPLQSSAGSVTYSLSNLHGDTMATINADGTLTGKYMTGPFGEVLELLPSGYSSDPSNASDGTTYGYAGSLQKAKETKLAIAPIQMGARVYVAELGRFLQVDSIEGGTLNSYVYAHDPVGGGDYSGRFFQAAGGAISQMVVSLVRAANLF
jgi:large repetitive protein